MVKMKSALRSLPAEAGLLRIKSLNPSDTGNGVPPAGTKVPLITIMQEEVGGRRWPQWPKSAI